MVKEPEITSITAPSPPPPSIAILSPILYPLPPLRLMDSGVIAPAGGIVKLETLNVTVNPVPSPVMVFNPVGAPV